MRETVETGSKTEMKEQEIRILAIESSCDETAAAVVQNGRTVLSSVIVTDCDPHIVRRGGAGDRIEKAYGKN